MIEHVLGSAVLLLVVTGVVWLMYRYGRDGSGDGDLPGPWVSKEVCELRMVLGQDDASNWYLIPETEVDEFRAVVGYVEFDKRWGKKRLAMHPIYYSFTDLQVRKI